MLPNDFCYYLLGVAEMSPTLPPTPDQWKAVTARLDTVFEKVTPNRAPVISSPEVTVVTSPIDLRICAPSRSALPEINSSDLVWNGANPFRPSGDMDKVETFSVSRTC